MKTPIPKRFTGTVRELLALTKGSRTPAPVTAQQVYAANESHLPLPKHT